MSDGPSKNNPRHRLPEPLAGALRSGPAGRAAPTVFALVILAFLAGFGSTASAHDYSAGTVRVQHPFATPTDPGATSGAAYFARLDNAGSEEDRLVAASSPVSAGVEVHITDTDPAGGTRMRQVEDLPIPPKAKLKLRPGKGYHLMLIDLKAPLVEGETFPMTLEFQKGGKVAVRVQVQTPRLGERAEKAASGQHKH